MLKSWKNKMTLTLSVAMMMCVSGCGSVATTSKAVPKPNFPTDVVMDKMEACHAAGTPTANWYFDIIDQQTDLDIYHAHKRKWYEVF